MMKLLQPISFRRIFLTILSAVIGWFVGISIWYFGFTPMGRDHFIQIQNYKEQEQYRKNDYDEYFQLPLLSGFDWNTIWTWKQEFTLTMSEYNSYFKNGTGEKITNYGNRVKIPMQTMMNSSQSGFIIKIIDPEPDQRVFFNIYRIMDKYYSGGILSPLRYYVSFLTQIPFVSKSDYYLLNLKFGSKALNS